MKILIADDDPASRRLLEVTLTRRGYDVVVAVDGHVAWDHLQRPDAPRLAILDWMMPGYDGPELCRMLRALPEPRPAYLMLLTTNARKQDVSAGLQAGADDYLTKPFDREELVARLQVGARLVQLQHHLATRVRELEEALSRVTLLRGLLPICCYCKNVRDDHNYWQQVEHSLAAHSDARFSPSICPDCYSKVVKPPTVAAGGPCSEPAGLPEKE